MILKFLRGLGGGSEQAAPSADPVEYNGFFITPNPQKVAGGWSTQGVISKVIDGEEKTHSFVRSDTLSSRDEAASFAVDKGRRIVDEQGERIFR